jgi:HipA N-terminal domain
MFPFFDGLIPEGWLLELAEHNWKLNARDRMGLLLACCKDCIGAVSIIETENQLATCNVYFVTKNRIKISLIFIRHVAVKFLVVRSQPYFHIQPNRCWNWMSGNKPGSSYGCAT